MLPVIKYIYFVSTKSMVKMPDHIVFVKRYVNALWQNHPANRRCRLFCTLSYAKGDMLKPYWINIVELSQTSLHLLPGSDIVEGFQERLQHRFHDVQMW